MHMCVCICVCICTKIKDNKNKPCLRSKNRTEITDIQEPFLEGKANSHGQVVNILTLT